MPHRRRRDINTNDCPEIKKKMPLVVFMGNEKLREHVGIHFSDDIERGTWNAALGENVSYRAALASVLRSSRCYWTMQDNPRDRICKECPQFDNCSDTGMRDLERKYVNAITKLLKESFSTPLHVHFEKHEYGTTMEHFAGLHDTLPIIVRASRRKGTPVFNVLTCHVWSDIRTSVVCTAEEMLGRVKHNIRLEAEHATIRWCEFKPDINRYLAEMLKAAAEEM